MRNAEKKRRDFLAIDKALETIKGEAENNESKLIETYGNIENTVKI